MSWKPTTRGTTQSGHVCHHGTCRKINTRLDYYLVKNGATRYLCDNHWGWACLLFQITRKCSSCKRNYNAEINKEKRTKTTVKFLDKWWRLCPKHYKYLDDELCIFTGLDLPLYD